MDINCNGIHHTANLTNSGILKLLKPCEFRNKQVRIPFEKKPSTELEYKQPAVDHSIIWNALTEQFRNLTIRQNSKTEPITKKLSVNIGNHKEVIANLAEGKKSIEELQNEWEREEQSRKIDNQEWEISVHRVSMVTGGSTLITIIAIGVVILAMKNRRKKKNDSMSIQLTTVSTIPTTSETQEKITLKKEVPQPFLNTTSEEEVRKPIEKRPSDITFACV